jgi:hypothetical protein
MLPPFSPQSGITDQDIAGQPAGSPMPGIVPGIMPPFSVKDMTYGGDDLVAIIRAQSGQMRRVERTVPRTRRGRLLPTIPRTKAETVYIRDNGQALQNPVINPGVVGVGNSGVAVLGTVNKAGSSGAVNRYLYNKPTLNQI